MQRKYIIASFLSLIGLTVWLTISLTTDHLEAWDSNYYYTIGLPIIFLATAVAGYLDPRHRLLWAISIFILQLVAMIFQSEEGPLLIVGLIFFAFFSGVAYACAYIGSLFHLSLNRNKKTD